jgi:hypothetical protein
MLILQQPAPLQAAIEPVHILKHSSIARDCKLAARMQRLAVTAELALCIDANGAL